MKFVEVAKFVLWYEISTVLNLHSSLVILTWLRLKRTSSGESYILYFSNACPFLYKSLKKSISSFSKLLAEDKKSIGW